MGMYTELIFGADLKEDTPQSVISALSYMMGNINDKPKDFPLPDGRFEWLFRGGSYYFAVNNPVSKMWQDINECWRISTRSNIENYGDEIEVFLEWIKPYIDGGSGARDMYAIVMYEEFDEPKIYYLNE